MCVDCGRDYCGQCSAHLEPRPRLCHTCQRFYGNLLQRAELMKLKVKELRDYLHLHQVATHLCREKEELVELVLGHQSSSSEASTPESAPPPLTTPAADQATLTVTQTTPTEAQAPPTEAQALHSEPPTVQSESPQEEEEEEEEQAAEGAPRRRASLSDLHSEEDIEGLSVRRLKEILARNFVDYKGCCERWELQERVKRLYRDKTNLQQEEGAAAEERLCRICMDAPIDCVLLECGHMVTCTNCGKRMSECPICRQYVIRAVHVFRS